MRVCLSYASTLDIFLPSRFLKVCLSRSGSTFVLRILSLNEIPSIYLEIAVPFPLFERSLLRRVIAKRREDTYLSSRHLKTKQVQD